MQCRPGHHWNAEMEYCDDPRNAGCDGDTNFPQLLPDCPVSFTGNVPHPDNCEYYIHCANGNRFIQRCPHLFNFDIVSEVSLLKNIFNSFLDIVSLSIYTHRDAPLLHKRLASTSTEDAEEIKFRITDVL